MRSLQAVSKAGRWIVVAGALAGVGVATASARDQSRHPSAATARALHPLASHSHGLTASAAKAKRIRLPGVVFGGATSQTFPVVIQVTRNLKKVTLALIGWGADCTSGGGIANSDNYVNLKITRKGAFGASFGPQPAQGAPPGQTETDQGSVAGRFNKAHTKVAGTWRFTAIFKNATTGAVVDTCDSGFIRWSAKQ
jgi:hypothetical protein